MATVPEAERDLEAGEPTPSRKEIIAPTPQSKDEYFASTPRSAAAPLPFEMPADTPSGLPVERVLRSAHRKRSWEAFAEECSVYERLMQSKDILVRKAEERTQMVEDRLKEAEGRLRDAEARLKDSEARFNREKGKRQRLKERASNHSPIRKIATEGAGITLGYSTFYTLQFILKKCLFGS